MHIGLGVEVHVIQICMKFSTDLKKNTQISNLIKNSPSGTDGQTDMTKPTVFFSILRTRLKTVLMRTPECAFRRSPQLIVHNKFTPYLRDRFIVI